MFFSFKDEANQSTVFASTSRASSQIPTVGDRTWQRTGDDESWEYFRSSHTSTALSSQLSK